MMCRIQRLSWLTCVVAALCSTAIAGCEREKAKQRVLEAVNPPHVDVTNGQVAVLSVAGGFAVIIPNYVRHNDISYRVLFSTNGQFHANSSPIIEAVAPAAGRVEIQGIPVFIGYGGENMTSIGLDTGDVETGIAVFATNDLRLLDVSQIKFRRGKPLSPDDLMKMMGADHLVSRTNRAK